MQSRGSGVDRRRQAAVVGKVLQGTCGWTDDSIQKCGRFYPAGVKTAEDRLEVYSKHFPCVEVDSSSYAIPSPASTKKWAAKVPPGFVFHFKAFGLFCHRSCPYASLPWEVKQQMSADAAVGGGSISLTQLGPSLERAAWDTFHKALEPVVQAGRMGCVVFQFQTSFHPTPDNRKYVEHCRRMLRADLDMAVELRDRAWFQDDAAAEDVAAWLRALGICLIAADELHHETYQRNNDQRGLAPGQKWEVMHIALKVTTPSYFVVRLHRRHGTTDRILPPEEIQGWAQRLAVLAAQVQGPLYYLWGTDWEDAPVLNARALEMALPAALRYDYKSALAAAAAKRPGSIMSFLQRPAKAQKVEPSPPPPSSSSSSAQPPSSSSSAQPPSSSSAQPPSSSSAQPPSSSSAQPPSSSSAQPTGAGPAATPAAPTAPSAAEGAGAAAAATAAAVAAAGAAPLGSGSSGHPGSSGQPAHCLDGGEQGERGPSAAGAEEAGPSAAGAEEASLVCSAQPAWQGSGPEDQQG